MVCYLVYIKEHLLLIRKSWPCGCSGFPLFIWVDRYHMSDATTINKMCCVLLNKTFPSFQYSQPVEGMIACWVCLTMHPRCCRHHHNHSGEFRWAVPISDLCRKLCRQMVALTTAVTFSILHIIGPPKIHHQATKIPQVFWIIHQARDTQ